MRSLETGERPVCPRVSPRVSVLRVSSRLLRSLETGERPVCPRVSPGFRPRVSGLGNVPSVPGFPPPVCCVVWKLGNVPSVPGFRGTSRLSPGFSPGFSGLGNVPSVPGFPRVSRRGTSRLSPGFCPGFLVGERPVCPRVSTQPWTGEDARLSTYSSALILRFRRSSRDALGLLGAWGRRRLLLCRRAPLGR